MSFATLLLFAAIAPSSVALADEVTTLDAAQLPLPASDLLAVRAFSLDQARPYPWMAGHAPFSSGLLLALEVFPALALPRQTAEPVLYVGDVPAERLNVGYPSGRLLVLIPGEPDLQALPVFFGPPALPERIDPAHAAGDLAQARAQGLTGFSAQDLQQAQAAGGEALSLSDSRGLDHAIADWIEAWAPDEQERATNLRTPAP